MPGLARSAAARCCPTVLLGRWCPHGQGKQAVAARQAGQQVVGGCRTVSACFVLPLRPQPAPALSQPCVRKPPCVSPCWGRGNSLLTATCSSWKNTLPPSHSVLCGAAAREPLKRCARRAWGARARARAGGGGDARAPTRPPTHHPCVAVLPQLCARLRGVPWRRRPARAAGGARGAGGDRRAAAAGDRRRHHGGPGRGQARAVREARSRHARSGSARPRVPAQPPARAAVVRGRKLPLRGGERGALPRRGGAGSTAHASPRATAKQGFLKLREAIAALGDVIDLNMSVELGAWRWREGVRGARPSEHTRRWRATTPSRRALRSDEPIQQILC